MRRNKFWVMAGFSFLLIGSKSPAVAAMAGQAHDFGLGAIFGSPTGLSAKYWLNSQMAIDGALAWNFGGREDRLQIQADHLWHIDIDKLRVPQGRLPVYVGLGLRVLAGDDSEAGIRIPLGMSYLFDQAPLEIFAEVVPAIEFAPDTDGDVDGGVGIRYYFK